MLLCCALLHSPLTWHTKDESNVNTPATSQGSEKAAHQQLQEAATYCGEAFDASDPSRTLRIVRDFLNLFDRVLTDIKVTGVSPRHCTSSSRRLSGVKSNTLVPSAS